MRPRDRHARGRPAGRSGVLAEERAESDRRLLVLRDADARDDAARTDNAVGLLVGGHVAHRFEDDVGAFPVREVHDPGERFQFLDPAAALDFWGDTTARMAHDAVAILRAEAGRNPYDQALTDLVGELSTRSADFRRLGASHDVRYHRTGTRIFHHPVAGRLELDHEALVLPADPGLQLNVYTAVPGSPSHDGLRLLASWAATRARESAGEPNSASTFTRSGNS